MNVKADKLENNMAKITVTVPAEEFTKAVTDSYNRNKGKYPVQGFRKGHAPQKMIENTYGEGVFFEDAINHIIDATYSDAIKESGLDIVSRANFDLADFGKGKDFVYTAEVATRPEVELGQYKGLEIENTDDTVTEEDLNKAIEQEQKRNSRLIAVTDRAAAEGDTVVIDFDGSVDGVHFDGGKAEDYSLKLGSHSFIEGFEDQVVGHNAGDEFDINVTFPENYGSKDLAGKPAVFAIRVKEIKAEELPELDDEFASEVSEFDTLAEYKADLQKKLETEKANRNKAIKENRVVDKAIENCKLDLPELMVETKIDSTIEDYSRQMQSQGMTIEDYMKFTGMTLEKLREQVKPQAEKDLKTGLVLEAIAKAENFTVDDKEIEDELQKMADSYQMKLEDIKKYMTDADKENIGENLKIQKAVQLLVDSAVLK
ncbi:MAG: trigger factor [Lachnospiraceae bacterium]|nr:trigger factor [Lachnospiraceae bacterium]